MQHKKAEKGTVTATLEVEMGPQTLADLMSTLAPMIWACGCGFVLIVVAAVVVTR